MQLFESHRTYKFQNSNPLVVQEGLSNEKEKCRNCRFLLKSKRLYKCLNDEKKRMIYSHYDACKLFQDKY